MAQPPSTEVRKRSPAEIRRSIEENRAALAVSIGRLRGEVAYITDWRGYLERNRREVLIGAAVVGMVVGARMLRRRRRN